MLLLFNASRIIYNSIQYLKVIIYSINIVLLSIYVVIQFAMYYSTDVKYYYLQTEETNKNCLNNNSSENVTFSLSEVYC